MESDNPKLRPRRVDYAMWTLVGLSMVATANALLDHRDFASWVVGIGWIALGALLIRWRWRALRQDTEAWNRRSAAGKGTGGRDLSDRPGADVADF